MLYPQSIANDVEDSVLIGRACIDISDNFDFLSAIFISLIIMEIQTHKRMRKAWLSKKKVRVLFEEVAFERAMFSRPTIRQ